MADLKEPVGMGLSNNGQACPALMFRDLWRVDDYVLSKKLYEVNTYMITKSNASPRHSKLIRSLCRLFFTGRNV